MATIADTPGIAAPGRGSVAAPGRLRARLRRGVRHNAAGYLFLLPWLVGFFGLTLIPTLASLYLSFTDYDLLTAAALEQRGELFLCLFPGRPVCLRARRDVPLCRLVGAAEAHRRTGACHGARPRRARHLGLPGDLLSALAARLLGRGRGAVAADFRRCRPGQPVARAGRPQWAVLDHPSRTTRCGRWWRSRCGSSDRR